MSYDIQSPAVSGLCLPPVCRHCRSETTGLLGYTFGNTCSNKNTEYMPVTIHCYINKICWVDIYIYIYIV